MIRKFLRGRKLGPGVNVGRQSGPGVQANRVASLVFSRRLADIHVPFAC